MNCLNVSFDSLINAPAKFEGKCIELDGYLNLQFEHVGFFKSKKKSYEAGAVWVTIDDTIAKQIDKYYPNGLREKVSIKGVFNRTNKRFGFFGEVRQISCVEIR